MHACGYKTLPANFADTCSQDGGNVYRFPLYDYFAEEIDEILVKVNFSELSRVATILMGIS